MCHMTSPVDACHALCYHGMLQNAICECALGMSLCCMHGNPLGPSSMSDVSNVGALTKKRNIPDSMTPVITGQKGHHLAFMLVRDSARHLNAAESRGEGIHDARNPSSPASATLT